MSTVAKYHSCDGSRRYDSMDDEPRQRVKILKDLRGLLDQMDSSKVTLIGDIMLDRYYHGYSNRLISTAPVPVLKIQRSEESNKKINRKTIFPLVLIQLFYYYLNLRYKLKPPLIY